MKKGDMKKQDILQTAEKMFCRNGFDATSVQDILDALHTSKGSFYHHFVSKESVLEAICVRRAAESCERVAEKIDERRPVTANLNTLMAGMIPLNGESLTFLLMLLPVFHSTDGVQVRAGYCAALANAFQPLICKELARGTEEEVFLCREPEFAAQRVALIVNDLWCRICDRMLQDEENGILTDPGNLLTMIEDVRTAIERMLCAPYGSVQLVNLAELASLSEQIHLHWK